MDNSVETRRQVVGYPVDNLWKLRVRNLKIPVFTGFFVVDNEKWKTLKFNIKVVDKVPQKATRPGFPGRVCLRSIYFAATTFSFT